MRKRQAPRRARPRVIGGAEASTGFSASSSRDLLGLDERRPGDRDSIASASAPRTFSRAAGKLGPAARGVEVDRVHVEDGAARGLHGDAQSAQERRSATRAW